MDHVMTIKAYERKLELGGGFRGVVIDCKQKRIIRESEVLPSYESARHFAQSEAHKLMGDRPYKRAYVSRSFVGNKYVANIWA